SLGVCDKTIAEIIWLMRECKGVQGAKISGSGLGDCVVALGAVPASAMCYEAIPVNVSKTGVVIDA
ncbi:MAG: GHMP kinase, partial [Pontibacterium sp.]